MINDYIFRFIILYFITLFAHCTHHNDHSIIHWNVPNINYKLHSSVVGLQPTDGHFPIIAYYVS